MSTVYPLSEADRAAWRKHNLDDLLAGRAKTFEEKLRWLEAAQETAKWFEESHRAKGSGQAGDTKLVARVAEEPPAGAPNP